LLTDHGWRLTTFLENGVNMTTAYFAPCELDDIFTFSTDYNYTIDEGPSKCDPANPQIIETGTWAFGNNQNMLILDPGANEADLNILQLDANTFIYEEVEYNNTLPSDSSVYRVTLVKS
jgi:hypothetical protein